MDIQDVAEFREQLRREIIAAVRAFESETGALVTGIDYETTLSHSEGGHPIRSAVSCEVRVEVR